MVIIVAPCQGAESRSHTLSPKQAVLGAGLVFSLGYMSSLCVSRVASNIFDDMSELAQENKRMKAQIKRENEEFKKRFDSLDERIQLGIMRANGRNYTEKMRNYLTHYEGQIARQFYRRNKCRRREREEKASESLSGNSSNNDSFALGYSDS